MLPALCKLNLSAGVHLEDRYNYSRGGFAYRLSDMCSAASRAFPPRYGCDFREAGVATPEVTQLWVDAARTTECGTLVENQRWTY